MNWSAFFRVVGGFALLVAFVASGPFSKARPRVAYSAVAIAGLSFALAEGLK